MSSELHWKKRAIFHHITHRRRHGVTSAHPFFAFMWRAEQLHGSKKERWNTQLLSDWCFLAGEKVKWHELWRQQQQQQSRKLLWYWKWRKSFTVQPQRPESKLSCFSLKLTILSTSWGNADLKQCSWDHYSVSKTCQLFWSFVKQQGQKKRHLIDLIIDWFYSLSLWGSRVLEHVTTNESHNS